jgi:mannose-6-phosphate isomerase-like protein (cupin superfamily)
MHDTNTTTAIPVGVPFDPSQQVVGLARSTGEARFMARNVAGPPHRLDGYTLGAPMITHDPPQAGEMHPDGDEVLFVVSGRFTVTLELEPERRDLELREGGPSLSPAVCGILSPSRNRVSSSTSRPDPVAVTGHCHEDGAMMSESGGTAARRPMVLGPGEGRAYPMGDRVSAVFKADAAETADGYSISEWWLEPHTKGPGAHSHPQDDVFYVLAGTMSVMVGTEWTEAIAGSFVLVPGNVPHTFENRGPERAGMLNVTAPGTFEEHMPGIATWFRERSPDDSRA